MTWNDMWPGFASGTVDPSAEQIWGSKPSEGSLPSTAGALAGQALSLNVLDGMPLTCWT